jgi:hypothetical protein
MADNFHGVAVQAGRTWAGRSAEGAVVVAEASRGPEEGHHRASERREVVDRSLVEEDVLQEEQSVRWGKQVQLPDERQQVEAPRGG